MYWYNSYMYSVQVNINEVNVTSILINAIRTEWTKESHHIGLHVATKYMTPEFKRGGKLSSSFEEWVLNFKLTDGVSLWWMASVATENETWVYNSAFDK